MSLFGFNSDGRKCMLKSKIIPGFKLELCIDEMRAVRARAIDREGRVEQGLGFSIHVTRPWSLRAFQREIQIGPSHVGGLGRSDAMKCGELDLGGLAFEFDAYVRPERVLFISNRTVAIFRRNYGSRTCHP